MNNEVIISGRPYTFADYFRLNPDIEDLLAYFGHTLEKAKCDLPHATRELIGVAELRTRLEESVPYFNLTSEVARREVLIAPVMMYLAQQIHTKIRIEYPLKVSEQLQGTLDYLIRGKQNFLVVEAKNEDLERGFTQLAVELIALSQWREPVQEKFYGAVSIGRIWQFGILNRATKCITQDINLYRVPNELEDLLRILIAIVNGQ